MHRGADIDRALRLPAAANRSISDLVDETLKPPLAEDAADLAAFEERQPEATESMEDFVKRLQRHGRL